jgi:hypothetical protein
MYKDNKRVFFRAGAIPLRQVFVKAKGVGGHGDVVPSCLYLRVGRSRNKTKEQKG